MGIMRLESESCVDFWNYLGSIWDPLFWRAEVSVFGLAETPSYNFKLIWFPWDVEPDQPLSLQHKMEESDVQVYGQSTTSRLVS